MITQSLTRLTIHLNHLIQKKLWLKVIVGIILGVGLGILINPGTGLISQPLSNTLSNWLNLPGEIFMKLIQMVMVPLIFASIISGLASNVSDNIKSFGLWLLLYFVFTTVVAIVIGVIMSFLFNPGDYVSALGGFSGDTTIIEAAKKSDSLAINIPKSISNLIPVNPLESILQGEMLSIVIFTVIIGISITQLESKHSSPIIRFIEAIQKICMIVVGWAMRLVPFAVFGLMAALLAKTGIGIFKGLGYYMLVVILGLLLLMVFYLILYAVINKENPFRFLKQIKEAQLLAFSTASSAAVMPVSMKVANENLGVSPKISNFVIPIGATINMDGTALFQCVTVLFMAQSYGISLDALEVVLITLTVVAASIGTPAIPGGGVIILAAVLESSGIPIEGLVVIIGIDRILGMFRTAVNVTGDLTATAIFNKKFGS